MGIVLMCCALVPLDSCSEQEGAKMHLIIEYLSYFTVLVGTVYAVSWVLNIEPQKQGYKTLEGLRGVCAASVAIFHIYYRAGGADDNYWSVDYLPESIIRAFNLTGVLPVALFFMLSGFLFFRKALAPHFNTRAFIVGRVARIYPPIIAITAIAYVASLIVNGSDAVSTPLWFIRSLPTLFKMPFPTINGAYPGNSGLGVTWTLVWELRLYVAIPFIALLMRYITHKRALVVIICMVGVWLAKHLFIGAHSNLGLIMYFLCGFLIAAIDDKRRPADWICMMLFVVLISLLIRRNPFSVSSPLYVAVIFFFIRNGFSFYGLLTCRAVQLLGTCSYSLYLCHCITQFVAKHYLYSTGNNVWQLGSIVATGVLAPLMYKFVERLTIRRCRENTAPLTAQH
ncbi:acyltransferase family protein [Kosakonia sp. 1610]|uniref:acyltransferase family protein n=1 Tax=Kosakonia sp. 1610 TaxID=3156426 RepID=UPI003D2577AA